MAFSTTTTQIIYGGNGVSTTFAIPFDFEDAVSIKVELYDAAEAKVTPFDSPAQWSVVGTNVVTVAPVPVDYKLFVYRQSIDSHQTNYNTYQFPFDTMNVDLDRVYQLIQELRDGIARTSQLDAFAVANGTPVPSLDQILADIEAVQDVSAQLAALQAQITALDNDLSQQIADLDAELTQDIADLSQAMSDAITLLNTTDMTLASAIDALELTVADQNDRITALETPIIYTISTNGLYDIEPNEVALVTAATVTIEPLAGATNGSKATVKKLGAGTLIILNVDQAASKVFTSEDGSYTLLKTSLGWVII